MFSPIIPIILQIRAQINKTGIRIDARVIDLAHEEYFWWQFGKPFEHHLELELCIFEDPIPNKNNPMPN